jgi:hypothetical protein
MKKASWIVSLIAGLALGLFGLVYLFLQCRLLFSGDLLIYASPRQGIVEALLKSLVALFFLASAIWPFFLKNDNHPYLLLYYYSFAVGALVLAVLALTLWSMGKGTSPIYLTIPAIAFPSLYFLSAVGTYLTQTNPKSEKEA